MELMVAIAFHLIGAALLAIACTLALRAQAADGGKLSLLGVEALTNPVIFLIAGIMMFAFPYGWPIVGARVGGDATVPAFDNLEVEWLDGSGRYRVTGTASGLGPGELVWSLNQPETNGLSILTRVHAQSTRVVASNAISA